MVHQLRILVSFLINVDLPRIIDVINQEVVDKITLLSTQYYVVWWGHCVPLDMSHQKAHCE
jgi:hypothetical protein